MSSMPPALSRAGLFLCAASLLAVSAASAGQAPQQGNAADARDAGAADRLPHVLIVATGGTIASRSDSPEQMSGYGIADTGDDLVAAVPSIADVARVTVHQYSNKGSISVGPEDWLALAQLINEALGPQGFGERGAVDGVVVTHGTDALEETGYFLNLTVRSTKPVVMVGAMRPASAISTDGPLNLLSAVRVAAAPESSGRGALVVLNQEINAARDVTKTNTRSTQTFQSRSFGLLGVIDDSGVHYYRRTERSHTYDSEFDVRELRPADLPRVDVLYTYNGADGAAVDAFVQAGARGIVTAGAGGGGTTRGQSDALERAREAGVIVARSSRTGSGSAGNRGGTNRVSADDLNAQKARILLMLALTVTEDSAEIQRMFNTY